MFELVFVITLFIVLGGIFTYRFRYLQEYAEKTVMQMTVMNMRTGLRYKMAELMMENRMPELPALLKENPINWLEKMPVNYLGEIADAESREISPGNWYFDKKRGELVYRPRNHAYIEDSKAQPEFRYAARGRFAKRSGNRGQPPVMAGIALDEVAGGKWF